MIRFAACCLLMAVPMSGLHAATFSVGSLVDGPVPAAAGGLERLTDGDTVLSDDSASTGLTRSATAAIAQGGTAYEAGAEADFATGVLKTSIRTRSAIAALAPIGADNTARSDIESFESFSVTGNGSVELRLDLTGVWDIGGLDPLDPDFSSLVLYGGFYISTPSGAEEPFFRIREDGPTARLTGSVAETLSFTRIVADGETYGFNTFFFSTLEGSSGDSSVDWSGLLSVTPGGGATVTFGDPAFLAATPPTPVPLPASVLLLLGAVTAAAFLRRAAARG